MVEVEACSSTDALSSPALPVAASVLAELVSLQEENRRMEQRIIELSSQREFYRANNRRLEQILEGNSGTAFLNGSNPTGGNLQTIAGVAPGNKPPVASLPGGQDPQEMMRQQLGQPSSLVQLDTFGGDVGMVPQRPSDMLSPIPGQNDVQMGWTSAAGNTPARWTLSGWKQGAFEPQSGLTPLTDVSVPKTTA